MKTKIAACFVILCFLALSVTWGVHALQLPPLPHAFFGHVDVNGEPAPVGAQVEARGTGVRTGVEGNPLSVVEAGRYGGPGGFDPKLIVQGNVEDGTALEFYVDGARAKCAEPGGPWLDIYPFAAGAIQELNLRVGEPSAPTVQPSATQAAPSITLQPSKVATATPTRELSSPTEEATPAPSPVYESPTVPVPPSLTATATRTTVPPSPSVVPSPLPSVTGVTPAITTELVRSATAAPQAATRISNPTAMETATMGVSPAAKASASWTPLASTVIVGTATLDPAVLALFPTQTPTPVGHSGGSSQFTGWPLALIVIIVAAGTGAAIWLRRRS